MMAGTGFEPVGGVLPPSADLQSAPLNHALAPRRYFYSKFNLTVWYFLPRCCSGLV